MERLLDLWQQDSEAPAPAECQVYMVHQGDDGQRQAARLAETLRDGGLRVLVHAGSTGFKSQFRRADASGAVAAVIIGGDELSQRAATVKWLRAEAAGENQQESIAFDDLAAQLQQRI
jgi:histidyl-tRNA synthetase